MSRSGPATPRVRLRRLPHAAGLPPLRYESTGSAGADLRAAIDGDLTLVPGERRLVPTGLVLEIPAGWEGQVRPRSGLALAHGITLINSPGTVDSDYRGEVAVPLVNLGAESFILRRGDRIAQLVIAPVARARFAEATELSPTPRGDSGFGSTGLD